MIEAMFRMKPALIISPIFILPEPKTIALGGVATGIIKAKDEAIAAGIIRKSGFRFTADDIPAIIGIIVFAIAVLEVNSVRKVIEAVRDRRRGSSGKDSSDASFKPISSESPES